MLPKEILILRSSEITRNVYFSIYFCILKVFKESNYVTRKGTFAQVCEKWGHVPPGSYIHGKDWKMIAKKKW